MIIKEGLIKVEILSGFEKGPGSRSIGFYNKEMETSRDFTVALLKSIRKGVALDSMAGTGIRGLRIAAEAGWDVVINDISKANVSLIKDNAKNNNMNVEIWNKNFFEAVSTRKWDYIDIDPYGSPACFVDAAICNLKNDGIIGITMTDTANLEGRSIRKGYRIYGGLSQRGVFSRELAARIFLGFLLRKGASIGYGGTPLLTVREKHYIRVFVRFRKGSDISFSALKEIEEIELNGQRVGPLHVGKLYDPKTLTDINVDGLSRNTTKLYDRFKNEDLMFLFFTNEAEKGEVNIDRIIEELKNRGFRAGRTNFYEKGIKTDAKVENFRNIIENI